MHHYSPPQTCGSVWWKSLRSDEPLWCLRCGSCPVSVADKELVKQHAPPTIMIRVTSTDISTPCRCKSPPQRQTETLRPEQRCRWSTPGSSSCVWRRAAECGTPAQSCPGILPAWPPAWWCTASGSCRDTLWLRSVDALQPHLRCFWRTQPFFCWPLHTGAGTFRVLLGFPTDWKKFIREWNPVLCLSDLPIELQCQMFLDMLLWTLVNVFVKSDFGFGRQVLPANGGQLGLLLHLFSKDLQLLLERLFVVVGVDVVVVGHHGWQKLWTGEAEQLLKHLQVSDMKKGTFVFKGALAESVPRATSKEVHRSNVL